MRSVLLATQPHALHAILDFIWSPMGRVSRVEIDLPLNAMFAILLNAHHVSQDMQ
jgi:hypothetical protein